MTLNANAVLTFGGGLNEQDDINISADECISGENFKLDRQSRAFKPREPFDLRGTATNGEEIRGIMQLEKNDQTFTTIVQAGDTVYDVSSSHVFTAKTPTVNATSQLRGERWALTDLLYISDLAKLTSIKQWDGSTFSSPTLSATGFTTLYSSYIKAFARRLWHFNIKTDTTDLPHVILVSAFEDPLNYNRSAAARGADETQTPITNGDQSFWLVSPDLKPINGVAIFYDTMVISTEGGRLFKLTGSDATDFKFTEYYEGSSAVGPEGMVNIGNDVMFVRRGPAIELLSSTDRYGDIAVDDVSRFIPTSVQLLADPTLAVYDRSTQDVYFFTDGAILVFDKDINISGELSPWSKWTSQMTEGLNPKAALSMKEPNTGAQTVYFGGPDGQLYDVHGTSSSGDKDSNPIRTNRKTRLITELETINNILVGRVTYRRRGEMTLTMSIEWTDTYVDTTAAIPLKGPIVSSGTNFYGSTSSPSYYGDPATYYNFGGVSEDRISSVGFSPAGKAPGFFLELSANTGVQFLINRLQA